MHAASSPQNSDWQRWSEAPTGIGETPVWDGDACRLSWIDMFGPTFHAREDNHSPVRNWQLPGQIGSYALTSDRWQVLVALFDKIGLLDLASGDTRTVFQAPFDTTNWHFSDGRCDPLGRFWVGTNRIPGSVAPRGSAGYFRLDERGLQRVIGGVTISNGLAFSPDGRMMYIADADRSAVIAYDYDLETGTPSNGRIFAHLELIRGEFPDGATVDENGNYWIALYGRARVLQFDPQGRLQGRLRTPITHPTAVCFGGADRRTLFVTSACRFLSDKQLAAEPLAGHILAIKAEVAGIPEPLFRIEHLDSLQDI